MTDPRYAIFLLWAVFVGLVLGSFWNVAIARWPEDRSVVTPRSQCPSCGALVTARDNIPVLSWVLLRGACRRCGWSIPVTYPLVELLGGLLGFLTFRRFVPDITVLDVAHVAAAVVYFVFVSCLCIAAFVDVRHHIIPDEVSIYAIPVGILGVTFLSFLGYDGWLAMDWRTSVLGALAGGVSFGALAAGAYFVSGKEALGRGDVKLLAMVGAFTGYHPSLFTILLGSSLSMSAIGLVFTLARQRRIYLPLGPALAAWTLLYLFYADILLTRFAPHLARFLTLPPAT